MMKSGTTVQAEKNNSVVPGITTLPVTTPLVQVMKVLQAQFFKKKFASPPEQFSRVEQHLDKFGW